MHEFASKKWHPSDEELAAYIDGALSKEEAARVTQHLASCPSCYEIYSETLSFQLESEPVPSKGTVLDFPAGRRSPAPSPGWQLAAAAALLILGTGIGWYSFQSALLGPPPKLVVAQVTPPPVQNHPINELVWNHRRFRGGEDRDQLEVDLERQSFQVGALLVDFRLSTEAKAVQDAFDAWQAIGKVVREVDLMEEVGNRILAEAASIKSQGSLQEIATRSAATEVELGDSALIPEYLDFGKWVEAGRVSALTKDGAFFQDRKNRRFLAYVLRNKEIKLSPETRSKLEEIAQIWDKGSLSRKDLESIAKHLQFVLDQYDFKA